MNGNMREADRATLPAVARLYADNILNEPAIPPLLRDMADEVERLRFTDQEREAILKLRKWAREIAGDNAFVDQVCDAADEAAMAMDSLLERHK